MEGPDHVAILRGILRRHKRLVAGIFLGLAIPLLILLYFTKRPLYESAATISIEASTLEQIPFFKELPKKDNITTNVVLLKSRSLGEAVIDALPKESFDELLAHSQYTDYVLSLTNKFKQWMGQPPTVLSPQQRALAEIQNARMEFLQSPQAPGIISIKGTASSQRVAMDLVNTYIQMLLGRTRNINQDEARKSREFLEQQILQAKENLNKAEETLTKFQQQNGRIRLGSQTELDLVKLSQTENALAEAQASREVTSARIAALRQGLEQGKAKGPRVSTDAQDKERDETSTGPRGADTLAQFNAFKVAQENLARLEGKLAAMRERYTDVHPMVQITQEQVTKEQARVAQMAHALPAAPVPSEPRAGRTNQAVPLERSEAERQLAALETEGDTLQAKVETLKIQVDRLRKNLRNINQDELEFSNLRQTVESNRNLLTVLSDKLMGARIREQGEAGVIRIIDPASFPLQPTQSKALRFALMILAGAGLISFGTAYGVEFLRQPVETESDVRKTTGLAVLGSIGVIGKVPVDQRRRGKSQTTTLPAYLPNSPAPATVHMELYRAIRASVETERLKNPFRSILVTSPGPSEGKSTTILNLAQAFHEFGRRVLVIDADLRRPTLQKTLSLAGKPDLMGFLNGSATFEEVCRLLPSGVAVICGQSVREDPASLLASPKFKNLIEQASQCYDLILIDSPPLLAVPDNLLLVAALDRVILVVKASATSKRDLQKAEAILKTTNVEILGVILNQANPRDVDYYRPRYRKYYKLSEGKPIPEGTRRRSLLSWGKKK